MFISSYTVWREALQMYVLLVFSSCFSSSSRTCCIMYSVVTHNPMSRPDWRLRVAAGTSDPAARRSRSMSQPHRQYRRHPAGLPSPSAPNCLSLGSDLQNKRSTAETPLSGREIVTIALPSIDPPGERHTLPPPYNQPPVRRGTLTREVSSASIRTCIEAQIPVV